MKILMCAEKKQRWTTKQGLCKLSCAIYHQTQSLFHQHVLLDLLGKEEKNVEKVKKLLPHPTFTPIYNCFG